MDIDFILGNKKRKPTRKSSRKDPLINLFKGQGNPILGDRITKKQAKVFKGPSKNLFGDWDKDGVINALDCQPRNRKKHMPTIYHGTERRYIPKIRTYGITPQEYPDVNKPHSYWTTKKNVAESYGGVILSTHVSEDEATKGTNKSIERSGELRPDGEVMIDRTVPFDKIHVENPRQLENKAAEYHKMKRYGAKIKYDSEGDPYYDTQVTTPYGLKMRRAHQKDMTIHRSDTSMAELQKQAKNNDPIEVDEGDFNRGVLRDGKHRLLAAAREKVKLVNVRVYPDQEVRDTIIQEDEE